MPSASASGANTSGGGSARNREHKQGNQDRKVTPEQAEAVVRIRRCQATAFYDILGLEAVRASCSDSDIKKAYRKLSLLTHPDKNGHEHAHEAFQMVSRAFSVLSDKDKRAKYDRFGVDPDSRFGAGGGGGAGSAGGNPFAGFARRGASGGQAGFGPGMFDDEINTEEIFRQFFGGGFGGGPFGGPQFVFNMGGGPGIRVHQFGGPRPRTRPRNPGQQEPEGSLKDMIIQLLPIIILFILPLLTNLFGAIGGTGSTPSMPNMKFDEAEPEEGFTFQRTTPNLKIDYFVRESDVAEFNQKKLFEMDQTAELMLLKMLRIDCEQEQAHKRKLADEAQGWFYQDPEKMALAVRFETPSCSRLESLTGTMRGR